MEWDPADATPARNYHFMISAVAPRPIAWVTTLDAAGVVNVAPFSWFQSVCADPPMVVLSIAQREPGVPKDTARNILETGQFVINVAPDHAAQDVVDSSWAYPPGHSEAEALGLQTNPSATVAPPRLAASPVHLECRLEEARVLGRKEKVHLILATVQHIAADDAVLDPRGNVDPDRLALLGRLGGRQYCSTTPHRRIEVRGPDQRDAAAPPGA